MDLYARMHRHLLWNEIQEIFFRFVWFAAEKKLIEHFSAAPCPDPDFNNRVGVFCVCVPSSCSNSYRNHKKRFFLLSFCVICYVSERVCVFVSD